MSIAPRILTRIALASTICTASAGVARADLFGPYHIQNAGTLKCVGVVDGSANDGARVEQETCSTAPSQLWWISGDSTGGGNVVDAIVLNYHSGKCLEIDGPYANFSPLDQWQCFGGFDTQHWNVKSLSGGNMLQNASHNFCLDVENGSPDEGLPLQIWSCNKNTSNQRWLLFL